MKPWKLVVFAALLCPFLLRATTVPTETPVAAREIDVLLRKGWQAAGVTINPPASDETFVRRVYLDIVGRIPTLPEAREFLDNRESGKRAALIDKLLSSEGHAQHMFAFWADILRVQSRANGAQGEMTSKPYVEHIKKRIRENQPYDQFVRELLTAQGKIWDNPAIGYYMRDLGMPLDNMANTTRIFLGTRIECAQCHDHPFDRWKQMQFYQMAAFTYPLETNFTGIAAQDGASALKRVADKKPALYPQARWLGPVFDNLGDFVRYSKVQALPKRQLKLPHDYPYTDAKPFDIITPAAMLGGKVVCGSQSDTVKAFADWMTSPHNPRFNTVIANRLWKKVFGLGLIEPVDEMMDSTVATNPELLKHLEHLVRACRYDVRAYLRVLYNTEAYQREVTRAEIQPGESYSFTGPLLRRMTAEQVWDSFVTLIQATPELPGRHGVDAEMASRLDYKGKLSDALDLLDAQEIFDAAIKVCEAYEAGAARSKVLKDAYAAARKAEDKPLMEKLSLEIRSLNFVARTAIHEEIVVPAVARLYTQKTGKPAPSPIPVKMPSVEDLKKAGQRREYIDVPGYDMGQAIPREENAASEAREAVFQEEANRHAIPPPELKRYLAARRQQAREFMRAADIESPAPRGHYLRDFGQSDRDMIENANPDASIAQALVLMNGAVFKEIIQPYSALRLNLTGLKSDSEEMEVVYLSLLARKPTDREKETWINARQSGLESVEDLIHALVNTQQFIFIQ